MEFHYRAMEAKRGALDDSDDDDETMRLTQSSNGNTLLTWHQLPAWMHDNQYITDSYRRPTGSYKECAKTLFYLHNEYVNIWTHLLGFLLFLGLGIHFLWSHSSSDNLTWVDRIYVGAFIVSALTCLGCSCLFHCFSCHSEHIATIWNRCDYVGIVTLAVGSCFPLIYYGFQCHRLYQGSKNENENKTAIVLMKRFRTPAYRRRRTTTFIGLACLGLVPGFHGIYLYGYTRSLDTISLINMIMVGGIYVGGAFLYAARIPERWSPGTFNLFGSSHQIFHVCVLIALVTHYYGVMKAMAYWHSGGHDICHGFP
ncbi:hypothetical protein [Absidia glauca]|uniref:Uncharacterized protein n=1 Tax=Absidia glauca TaxID=4829 RepID=A0A168KR52_ABSGL|nr:hypothetical protein [Absidia glauca]